MLYGAACPCVFISKIEIVTWPIFGTAARMAGAVFVDRSRTAVGSAATADAETALKEDVCVLLFPEGTSTDGSTLLPFHSAFYEPAVLRGRGGDRGGGGLSGWARSRGERHLLCGR